MYRAGSHEGDALMDTTMTAPAIAPTGDTTMPVRHVYSIRFSITGRIRFLSHLETVDTMLSGLRRTGVRIALSQGFRPKPRIRMTMPRPVGVEAWNESLEIELVDAIDPDELAMKFIAAMPAGVVVHGVTLLPAGSAKAASRVLGATFRLYLDGATNAELVSAVELFQQAGELLILRRSPKGVKEIEVRGAIAAISVIDNEPVVRYYARLTETGSVRPDEVVRALEHVSGAALTAMRIVREEITLGTSDSDGIVAEPELVGADVPDGPEKPWGAC